MTPEAPGTTAPFDPSAPVPPGLTLLEASAGTGKTHCITTLWLRLVLDEGVSPQAIAAVTFTRAAAVELRLRLRRRLETLRREVRGDAAGSPDGFTSNICNSNDPGIFEARIDAALAALDASPVGTIHQFAWRGLRELGLEPPIPAPPLDERAFATRVADGFWARLCVEAPRALHDRATRARLSPATLATIARAILAQPLAPVLLEGGIHDLTLAAGRVRTTTAALPAAPPAVTAPDRLAAVETLEELLGRFVADVRLALDTALTASHATLPNAAPGLLLEALQDTAAGHARTLALQRSFRAALIDEFQDTDATQWTLFRHLFVRPDCRLLLIGDPKQSIYAFRQAELRIWLAAEAEVDHRLSLAINRRADGSLVAALNALFDLPPARAALAAQGLGFTPATAAQPASRLPIERPPLDLTLVTRPTRGKSPLPRSEAESLVLPALAANLAALAASGALPAAATQAAALSSCAVLVRSHRQVEAVQAILASAGIPCSSNGSNRLFATPEAVALARILHAVLAPQRTALVRGALVSALLGYTPREVAANAPASTGLLAETAETLRSLADRWTSRGFYAMFRELVHVVRASPARRHPEADTRLRRLARLGEQMHAADTEQPRSPARLLAWLEARIVDPPDDAHTAEPAPDGVRVMTVHAAKGLEFPFVFLPFAWLPPYRKVERGLARISRDPAHGSAVRLRLPGDMGMPHDETPEGDGEDPSHEELRLLYVSLTRARHTVSLFVPPQFAGWADSPLATLLGPDPEAPESDRRALVATLRRLDPQALRARLERRLPPNLGQVRLRHLTSGELALEPEAAESAASEALTHDASPPLASDTDLEKTSQAFFSMDQADPTSPTVRRWTRPTPLDTRWRRSSFSSIVRDFDATSRLAAAPRDAAIEPPDEPEAREAGADAPSPPVRPGPEATRGPSLSSLPGGTRLGHAIHQVLELHDLRDLAIAPLSARAARALSDHGLAPSLAEPVADALAAALATPLPTNPAFRLTDVGPRDRLSEVDFVLPITVARDSVTAADLVAAVRPSAPAALAPWLDGLAHQPMRPLRGLLSGSIDAVLRGPDGRIYLVDWKSNHLGPDLAAYTPDALWHAMEHHHYHLQYLIYAVALRRHLLHRDPTTPPDRFGGVLYCFLRGMHPENPRGTGVFAFRPPEPMLDALDQLLAPPLPQRPLG